MLKLISQKKNPLQIKAMGRKTEKKKTGIILSKALPFLPSLRGSFRKLNASLSVTETTDPFQSFYLTD